MNDLWIFIEHGRNRTWTRAAIPAGIQSIRDLIAYLQRGGRLESNWIELPERARYTPRAAGQTIIARLEAQ